MKDTLKRKWIKALRSGKYKQGMGQLRSLYSLTNSVRRYYCCLGVLCDVTRPDGWRGDVHEFEDADKHGLLSDASLSAVGLNRAAQDRLAGLNDGGALFDEIADVIEESAL
jgi:hypothetical protein